MAKAKLDEDKGINSEFGLEVKYAQGDKEAKAMHETTLFVTQCSGKKNGAGDPLTLYTSPRVQRFGKACTSAGVLWAILSGEHGLFLPGERHDPYKTELHLWGGELSVCKEKVLLPNAEGEIHIKRLVGAISASLEDLAIHRVVFYVGGTPPRICSYLLVLHQAFDKCTKRHSSPNDVLNCIKSKNSIYIANGMGELEEELVKCR